MFVSQLVGNFREIGLRIGHKQILRLRAIDRVAEAPAADRFHAFAMSALRPLRRQTSAALAARRDRARHDAISFLVTGDPFAQFLDDADRFVSDNQPSLHRVFPAQDVEIRAANRRA